VLQLTSVCVMFGCMRRTLTDCGCGPVGDDSKVVLVRHDPVGYCFEEIRVW
jgi:hypothetical protein